MHTKTGPGAQYRAAGAKQKSATVRDLAQGLAIADSHRIEGPLADQAPFRLA